MNLIFFHYKIFANDKFRYRCCYGGYPDLPLPGALTVCFAGPVIFSYRRSLPSIMGQILDKIGGKQWRDAQMRKISDKIFNKIKNHSDKVNLSFEDLYIATLLVYNEINKRLPGPHHDPPSKERVRELIKESDLNMDQEIDREEFMKFILLLTSDTVITVSQGLVLTLVVAPTVAVVTKKSTEGVPGVGKLVQKLPASVYASLITLAALSFQNAHQGA
ncbi:uncharacterized protein LOC111016024 [Momordica charantia]|uniref:Uncharacterized protein LOC111016024 n=1 Tax=Momordica charantia TaxID=3673 RepID=A0A6J1D109_MOMCH|nr:uncharacterized protein LOC111016024 [Momordica charantia]